MITVNSLWIGNKLGPVHAACLRSFVRHGHDVVLHAYGKPEDTPEGVRLFDANRLMKQSEIVSHKKTSSLALASDIYRYRIQREGLGIYIDADMFCVKPMIDDPYLFGYETAEQINGAVLKIPQNSRLLKSILESSENPYFIPPWIKSHKIILAKMRRNLGFPRHIRTQHWGAIGPSLITYEVKRNNLIDKTKSQDVFYPLEYTEVDKLFEQGTKVADLITKNTVAMHLYNHAISGKNIPSNTPLYEIINS